MIADLTPGSLIVDICVYSDGTHHIHTATVDPPKGDYHESQKLGTRCKQDQTGCYGLYLDKEFMKPRMGLSGMAVWGPADQEQHLLRLCRTVMADRLDELVENYRKTAERLRELAST